MIETLLASRRCAAQPIRRQQQHDGNTATRGGRALRDSGDAARQGATEEDSRDQARHHEHVAIRDEHRQCLRKAEAQRGPQDDVAMSEPPREQRDRHEPDALANQIGREYGAELRPAQIQRLRYRRGERPHHRGDQAIEEKCQRAQADEQQHLPIQASEHWPRNAGARRAARSIHVLQIPKRTRASSTLAGCMP
jgi:hypothetical protein